MALNMKALRKVSLKGFAIGWDDCYVIVEAVGRAEGNALNQKLEELRDSDDTQGLELLVRQFVTEHTVKGLVMSTDENGVESPQEFGRDDVAQVVDFMNFAWQVEVMSVATGADRLKQLTI